MPNVSVYGPDHHFQGQWLDVDRCYLIFLHLVVGVSGSVWWFKDGLKELVKPKMQTCITTHRKIRGNPGCFSPYTFIHPLSKFGHSLPMKFMLWNEQDLGNLQLKRNVQVWYDLKFLL